MTNLMFERNEHDQSNVREKQEMFETVTYICLVGKQENTFAYIYVGRLIISRQMKMTKAKSYLNTMYWDQN